MQYASAIVVMHEGKFKVEKKALSVPEIVLLRRLHGGDDAVQNIRPEFWKRVSSFRAEKQRLLEIYGRKETTEKLIEECFPGEFPRLPTSLRDIATGNPVLDGEDGEDAESYDAGPAQPKKRRGKPAQTAPTPVQVNVNAAEPDEIRVEGEDDEPAELAEQDGIEDYRFLNDEKKPSSEQE